MLNVCKRLPEIPFIFAGSGPLENEVNQVKNICNMGFQMGKTLNDLIAEASFSIYPSEWYENCPFSVMESIVLGTPVIGSNIGGIPELIKNEETGLLFESGNQEDLYKKIIYLWNNKNIIQKFSLNCNKEEFDTLDIYCEKLIEIYNM